MALPVVTHLLECSEFSRTVAPYLPQLSDLPQQIWLSLNNPTELKNIYIATNPLITALAFSLFLAPIFLIVSEINKNYSQVDRMWSILPTIYNAHYALYAHLSGFDTQRMDNLLTFSLVWSARLTFNYWRKGGYSIGSEDYRWEVLKEWMGKPLFFIFNVVFISLAQSVLLFLVTTPTYVILLASRVSGAELNSNADMWFARGLMMLVLIEFFADQAQWDYQKAKKTYLTTAKVPHGYFQEDLDRGFVATGLWSYSRHPNFAAEQTIWVVLYQWGCWDSNVLYNWTFIGAFGYLMLFQASTWFTELITAKKYDDYKEYQKRVSKFIPGVAALTGMSKPGDFRDLKATDKVGSDEEVVVVKKGEGEKRKGKKGPVTR